MGNTLDTGCNSMCGLGLPSAKDLTRSTSLQNKSPEKKILKENMSLSADFKKTTTTNSMSPDSVSSKKVKSAETVNSRKVLRHSKTCLPSIGQIKEEKEKPSVNENDFRILQVLAEGRYGRICLVKKDIGKQVYVMKIISKKKMCNRTSAQIIEKEILETTDHPFIPKLLYNFENDKKLFLVMEYFEGGKLHNILKKLNRFSEEITRFYSAEVLLALEYLHEQKHVIYSDLKAKNILLDDDGHIRLIDYDLTKKIACPQSIHSLLESKERLDNPAPEVYKKNMTGKMIDYWAFGCFLYELLTGKKPFQCTKNGSTDVEKNILENKLEWPQFVTPTASDLIRRLLNPKIEERLGYHGIAEIKKHPFFSSVNWDKVLQRSVYPPLNIAQFKEENVVEEDESEDEEGTLSISDENTEDLPSIVFINEADQVKIMPLSKSQTSLDGQVNSLTMMPESESFTSIARSH